MCRIYVTTTYNNIDGYGCSGLTPDVRSDVALRAYATVLCTLLPCDPTLVGVYPTVFVNPPPYVLGASTYTVNYTLSFYNASGDGATAAAAAASAALASATLTAAPNGNESPASTNVALLLSLFLDAEGIGGAVNKYPRGSWDKYM